MAPIEALRGAIRDVPDFPKPGVVFKDITPVLADAGLFRFVVGCFVEECRKMNVSRVASIDARGFLFGATVAHELGVGFVPVRKKGKLPGRTVSLSYALEYGEAEVEMHVGAVGPGERVALIDDLLATGGTAGAAASLIGKMGAQVVQAQFLVELEFLRGREALAPVPVYSILRYA